MAQLAAAWFNTLRLRAMVVLKKLRMARNA